MSYKSTDDISVVLLDKEGFVITSEEMCETMKAAKERAKYLLSPDYARNCETTHERLGTDKVEIRVNGECIYDYFLASNMDTCPNCQLPKVDLQTRTPKCQ